MYNIIKLLKTRDKEKVLKEAGGKKDTLCIEEQNKKTAEFFHSN
jgi:hypothetical protein